MNSVQFDKAREQALKYIGRAERTAEEVRRHLADKGYPADVAEEIAARLTESGILDDARCAAYYIQESVRKRKGRAAIEAGLAKRGLCREQIADSIKAHWDPALEETAAAEELERLLRSGGGSVSTERAARRLAYLGYEPSLIWRLLERYKDEGALKRDPDGDTR